jgi:hypothetical protein
MRNIFKNLLNERYNYEFSRINSINNIFINYAADAQKETNFKDLINLLLTFQDKIDGNIIKKSDEKFDKVINLFII